MRWIFTALALAFVACGGAGKAGPVAAESAYTASLLRCVEQARTKALDAKGTAEQKKAVLRAEDEACRAKVNASWNVTETVSDGGAK